MGCEKPSDRFSLSPCACARKPTPTRFSFFSKPLVTPLTMLLTRARRVPDIAFASRLSSATSKLSEPLLLTTLTFLVSGWVKEPSGPLTVICSAVMVASAPFGSATGILPTRDILHSLGHVANHFATDTGCACFAISHHAARRGHDCHTQAVHDVGDIVLALVDAQTRTGHALKALDDRTASVIL